MKKENPEFLPVGAAPFRPEGVPFDPIMRTVRTIVAKLSQEERQDILTSWDRTRERIERMPRRMSTIIKMDISSFPEQSAPAELAELSDCLLEPLDDIVIRGKLQDEAVNEGNVDEIEPGDDVVIYTRSAARRPWV